MKYVSDHEHFSEMRKDLIKEINELTKQPKDFPNKKRDLKELKDKKAECDESIKSLRGEFYGLWGQLLSPNFILHGRQ